MAIGPCLCGDPYCSSCGDPSLAKYEAEIEALTDKLCDMRLDEYELEIFKTVGFAAVNAYRIAMDAKEIDSDYEPLSHDADIEMIGDDSAFFDGDIGNK